MSRNFWYRGCPFRGLPQSKSSSAVDSEVACAIGCCTLLHPQTTIFGLTYNCQAKKSRNVAEAGPSGGTRSAAHAWAGRCTHAVGVLGAAVDGATFPGAVPALSQLAAWFRPAEESPRAEEALEYPENKRLSRSAAILAVPSPTRLLSPCPGSSTDQGGKCTRTGAGRRGWRKVQRAQAARRPRDGRAFTFTWASSLHIVRQASTTIWWASCWLPTGALHWQLTAKHTTSSTAVTTAWQSCLVSSPDFQ